MYPKIMYQLLLLSKPKKQNTSINLSLPKIETIDDKHTYNAKDGTPLLAVHYIYPKISYPENPCFETTVNKFFSDKQKDYKAEEKDAKTSAENLYLEFPTTSLLPYTINTNYNTTLNIKDYLSFKLYNDEYFGGAHGNATVKGATFKIGVQTPLTYYDFFIDDKAKVDKTLQVLIEKQIQEQNLEEYIFPYEKGNLPLPETDSFYLLPKAMVFIYNTYEIAPYSAGTLFFTIPYEALKSILK